MTPETIARSLIENNHCICPGFISPEGVRELRADLEGIQSEGLFTRARIGQGPAREVHDEVRRDETYWIDRKASSLAQDALWLKLDTLKDAFNEFLFLGLSTFEGHYASYPSGGFYRRHRDSFQGEGTRIISLVLYLNADWAASDGGELRIYDGESSIDVAPTGGTMVCFLSDESEHEVLVSHEPRLSFSGWFR